jgi:hypothetical protein
LETAIKDTREIKESLIAANEAVIEANEAMLKENAHAVAASAKAAEEAEAPSAENDDLFMGCWTSASSHRCTDSVTLERNVRYLGTIGVLIIHLLLPPITERNQRRQMTVRVFIRFIQHTQPTRGISLPHKQPILATNLLLSLSIRACSLLLMVDSHQISNPWEVTQPCNLLPLVASPTTAMIPAPSSGGYDYGMDLMGMSAMTLMGAPIPEFNAPASTPVPPPNGPKSPTVAEVESIKREALNAEKSFRQSKELVDTLSVQVKNLEMVAKQAEDNLQAAEKKKGSFTAKSKKKEEVAAAQEQVNAERQKVNEARQQLAAAKK